MSSFYFNKFYIKITYVHENFNNKKVLNIFQVFFLHSVQGARCGDLRKIFRRSENKALLKIGENERRSSAVSALQSVHVVAVLGCFIP
jgi:hypothetical protein